MWPGSETRCRDLRLLVEVDDGGGSVVDGAVGFDALIAAHAVQPRRERSGQDVYMLYTGGTTGMPKGVMYRQQDFVRGSIYAQFVAMGLTPPEAIEDIAPLLEQISSLGPIVSVPCCPLMHGTGMWVSGMRALVSGGTVVLLEGRTFDAHEMWEAVERELITEIVIVGDAFARPMLLALQERTALGRPYETSSVRLIVSSGAIWSAEIKEGLSAYVSADLFDALGSTEGGSYGATMAGRGTTAQTAHFALVPGTRVVTGDGHDVTPGSGERGLLASQTTAFGYFKDPEKTARTFLQLDGHSYVMTGDWATVESDGTITLLGRGSNCINSGGEKIFPEEVEEALKRHPRRRRLPGCRPAGRAFRPTGCRGGRIVAARASERRRATRVAAIFSVRLQDPEISARGRRRPPRSERQGRLPVGEDDCRSQPRTQLVARWAGVRSTGFAPGSAVSIGILGQQAAATTRRRPRPRGSPVR